MLIGVIPESVQISVKNFKSLRDFSIDLKKFNVLIGPNGSGKTNVLELFKFATLCISPQSFPVRPFTPWWNFTNVVWSGKEDLPIRLDLKVSVESYEIRYGMLISGAGGDFAFLEESLHVPDYLQVHRGPTSAQYSISKKFLAKVIRTLKESRQVYRHYIDRFPNDSWVIDLSKSESFFKKVRLGYRLTSKLFLRDVITSDTDLPPITVPSPVVSGRSGHISVERYIAGMFNDSIVLIRQLDYTALRQPPPVNLPTTLEENGIGLINILFDWHLNNNIPERITQALETLFPNWSISFKLTDDGRIMLKVFDGSTALTAPSIPDGLYKLLTILTAIELNPKFLLIDEMDTSLHAKIIEHVIDELKTCNANVIITTHSPAVIDMVDIDDIVLLERFDSGTVSRRIDNPDQLNKELQASGLTVSEKLLYGKL